MKWDGVRSVVYLAGGRARLLSRRGRDDTAAYPDVVEPLAGIEVETAVLDGEIVVTDETGRPSFGLLQNRINLTRPGDIERAAATWPAQLMVFDVLELNGALADPGAVRANAASCSTSAIRRCRRRPGAGAAGLRRRPAGGPRHQPGARARGDRGQADRLGLPTGPARPHLAEDQAAPTQEVVIAGWRPGPGPARRRHRVAAAGRPDRGGSALRRPGRLRLRRPPLDRDGAAASAPSPAGLPAGRGARGRTPATPTGWSPSWSARSPTPS